MPVKKDSQSHMENLCNYIRKNIPKGYTMESLKWALVKQGNPRIEVEKAVSIVEKEVSRLTQKKPEPKITLDQSSPVETVMNVEPEKVPFWKRIFS